MKPKEILKQLAQIWKQCGSTLYIVGGSVRDELLNIKTPQSKIDYDLSSDKTPDEIIEMLKEEKYNIGVQMFPISVNFQNRNFGTVIIDDEENKINFVHTTFRIDSYKQDGSYHPTKIEFTKNIEEDAKRRDFTINAIYKNILTGEIVDFFNGVEDCKNKILKTVKDPNISFKEDALRIIRLIRFAATYSLAINEELINAARGNVDGLNKISASRINREFLKTPKSKQSKAFYLALGMGMDFSALRQNNNNKG
jgi:tRNA nucleotidyltransferase (CCA-adding enzyme)